MEYVFKSTVFEVKRRAPLTVGPVWLGKAFAFLHHWCAGCDEFSTMLPMLWYVRQLKGYAVEPSASTFSTLQSRTFEATWSWQVQRCIHSASDTAGTSTGSSDVFERLLACVKASLEALYRLPILLTRWAGRFVEARVPCRVQTSIV
jgi:hypothetical protein